MVKCFGLEIEVKHHHHQLENFYIIRIDPMFFAFLATIHSKFYMLLMRSKKNVPKARSLVKSNSPDGSMGLLSGMKSGMDLNRCHLNSVRLFQQINYMFT